MLFYRLFTANQCHSFSSLFPNKCTLFHTVQLILAWQHSANKAVPCQAVNFFPLAHHLWILPEKQQATINGYWPRQAPEGNLTISISCQCKTQLENKKCICSLGAISNQSKVHIILLFGAFGQEAKSDYLVQSWVISKCQDWRGIWWCGFSVFGWVFFVWVWFFGVFFVCGFGFWFFLGFFK